MQLMSKDVHPTFLFNDMHVNQYWPCDVHLYTHETQIQKPRFHSPFLLCSANSYQNKPHLHINLFHFVIGGNGLEQKQITKLSVFMVDAYMYDSVYTFAKTANKDIAMGIRFSVCMCVYARESICIHIKEHTQTQTFKHVYTHSHLIWVSAD
jgi:hypothetical protein